MIRVVPAYAIMCKVDGKWCPMFGARFGYTTFFRTDFPGWDALENAKEAMNFFKRTVPSEYTDLGIVEVSIVFDDEKAANGND